MNLGSRNNQHSFASIPDVNMARSNFDRSFAVKDTMNFDQLTPVYVEEIIPGDTINLNVQTFMRLAPQIRPLMDNMYVDFQFFFVPNRLVWTNWEKLNGAQDNPGDSIDYLTPQVSSGAAASFAVGSLADHFGIPTGVNNTVVNALPFRAYNLIYNEWYRDQNLIPSIVINKGDGPDVLNTYILRKFAKKHDYFTSCLIAPQKGSPVSLGIGATAPVKGIIPGKNTEFRTATNGGGSTATFNYNSGTTVFAPSPATTATYTGWAPQITMTGIPGELYADLSAATAITVNALRQAIMLQSIKELDNRGGTRYVEILRAHFNVISPDFRLQRPEFLSSGTIRINQHVIAQTSETQATSPQGNLAAYSTASTTGGSIGFTKSFVEHGFVIGIARARADVTYQQGLNKMWSRRARFDYFWPKLQELGEQAVTTGEIKYTGTAADNDVFGYQERFAEMRFRPSEIRGQFRSTYAQSLDVWHLAENFATTPGLNPNFIESNTPIRRNLTITDPNYPALLCDFYFVQKHARPMMTYGVPATLGRF